MRIFLDKETNDRITKMTIITSYTPQLLAMIEPQLSSPAYPDYVEEHCTQYEKNIESAKQDFDDYGDYWELKKEGTLPFYSSSMANYCGIIGASNFDFGETHNFEFCKENIDLKDKHYMRLLKRFGLEEAIDEENGFLSYKKLKKSKNFKYSFYFTYGEEKEITKDGL